ncbi:MAG: hypothetical protein IPI88_12865 [Chitinophagaceae bacterium]|nr:hypothetical protein [Chitinophagaceae bacterium]
MNKNRLKYFLDFVPLVIISTYSLVSVLTMLNSNVNLVWQHYLGIVFIILDIILFYKNHQLGVIFLGITLLLSLITLLSFNVGLVTNSLYITSARIPVFYGNAISLVWLILHFILSGRYYVGIVTKKYWQDFAKEIEKETGA